MFPLSSHIVTFRHSSSLYSIGLPAIFLKIVSRIVLYRFIPSFSVIFEILGDKWTTSGRNGEWHVSSIARKKAMRKRMTKKE